MTAKPEENPGGDRPPRAPQPTEGDELEPLPPLDGGEGEDDAAATTDELDDDEIGAGGDAEGTDPFDDRTGEDEPAPELEAGEAGAEGERSWLTDAEPAEPAEGAPPDFELTDLPDAGAP